MTGQDHKWVQIMTGLIFGWLAFLFVFVVTDPERVSARSTPHAYALHTCIDEGCLKEGQEGCPLPVAISLVTCPCSVIDGYFLNLDVFYISCNLAKDCDRFFSARLAFPGSRGILGLDWSLQRKDHR